MVMGDRIEDKRIGSLIAGQDCYVRVDAFNESGITAGSTLYCETKITDLTS